jgi:hypothetical protein
MGLGPKKLSIWHRYDIILQMQALDLDSTIGYEKVVVLECVYHLEPMLSPLVLLAHVVSPRIDTFLLNYLETAVFSTG